MEAIFSAGCFWGVEATFRGLDGVTDTAVGYLGGTTPNPTYEDICRKDTGHAEVVRVTFDAARIGYADLLDAFWANHDPTTLNRQGPDVGDQYRSGIFFHDDAQKRLAEESKAKMDAAGVFGGPIVTEISPASEFTLAEDYHQQYLEKRGLGVCHT